MASSNHGNGNGIRNVAVPDESRPDWRPQDEHGTRNRRNMNDDDDDNNRDDGYMARERERSERYWGDRRERPRVHINHHRRDHQEAGGPSSWRNESNDPSPYGPRGPRAGDQRAGDQRAGDQRESHRGKGPAGYTRSDERIHELACEGLTDDHDIDATNIEIAVQDGEVTLTGTVDDRSMKRKAEDLVLEISGVKDVHNQIRLGAHKPDRA